MGGIDAGRSLAGGLAAALIWIVEDGASVLYMDGMTAAMAAHDLSMEMTAGAWIHREDPAPVTDAAPAPPSR